MAVRANTIQLTIAAFIATSTAAWPQNAEVLSAAPSRPSLAQPSPVTRVSGVTQFGMPGDHKYIFCDGADCQQHTQKHFNEPPPQQQVVKPKAEPEYAAPVEKELMPEPKQDHQHKTTKKKRKATKKVRKHTNDCPVPK